MTEECIFCRIVAGKVPSDIVYQDENFVAFRDTKPKAPTHILIIPKVHIVSLAELGEDQRDIAGGLVMVARNLAESEGIGGRGYRLVINSGPDGGQVVPHLHLHLIGGKKLGAGPC